MAKHTINELLVLSKVVRERINNLKSLQESVAKKERFFGSAEKVVEPQYSVKDVDKKIVELQKFLLKTDTEIKKSNATTEVDIDFNADELLAPLL